MPRRGMRGMIIDRGNVREVELRASGAPAGVTLGHGFLDNGSNKK